MARYNRIISLVPSLTELLFDLGVADRLVGRTRFCIHPEDAVTEIPIVGGTKNPRIDKILGKDPDYIVANREENRRADIQKLQEHCRVNVTDITTIEDAMITIHELGNELDAAQEAKKLTRRISELLNKRPDEPSQRVAYLIWRDPWMTVGSDTYIHDVLEHWDLQNVFGDRTRYPKITLKEIARHSPDLILLSSEPFPFKDKHIDEVREACAGSRILLADGEWFSWYGSRMVTSFDKLNTWRKAIA